MLQGHMPSIPPSHRPPRPSARDKSKQLMHSGDGTCSGTCPNTVLTSLITPTAGFYNNSLLELRVSKSCIPQPQAHVENNIHMNEFFSTVKGKRFPEGSTHGRRAGFAGIGRVMAWLPYQI